MEKSTKSKILPCLLVLFLLCSILISGCTRKKTAPTDEKILYSVTDATGFKLNFTAKPQRIISLSISTDEILLDLVPTARIVALTKYVDDAGISNVVERAQEVKGRVRDTNPESILAMQPDLVILPDFTSRDTIQSLREMQLAVYVYATPYDLPGIRTCIKELGRAVGEETNAQALLARMDEKLASVKAKLGSIPLEKQKRVVFMSEKGAYYSPRHSFNDICAHAQVRNALAELNFTKPVTVAQEEIVRLNPDAFVLSGWIDKDEQEPAAVAHNLRHDASFSSVKAVQDNAIYTLPAKHLLSLSQYVVEASADLAAAVYGTQL